MDPKWGTEFRFVSSPIIGPYPLVRNRACNYQHRTRAIPLSPFWGIASVPPQQLDLAPSISKYDRDPWQQFDRGQ